MTENTAETTDTTTTATEAKSFTQDDVNALLAKQKREHFGDYGDLKKKAAQYDEISEQSKTEQQRATEALTAAEQRAASAEARTLRLEIAAEKGLTPAQAKRLVGASREELESDANDLLENFKPSTGDTETIVKPALDLDLGSRGTATTASGDPGADFAKFLNQQMAG